MIPPPSLQPTINQMLRDYAEELGLAVGDLGPDELQSLGFALRIADADGDPSGLDQDLRIANALDSLSDMELEDVEYLERLSLEEHETSV